MTTQTIRNGTSIDVPIPTGQTLKVVAVTGTYTITVTRGTGIGTALATAATGGSYGAYAYDSVVRIVASSASEIDFDVAVSPVVDSDTEPKFAFDTLGAVTGLVGPGGVDIKAAGLPAQPYLSKCIASYMNNLGAYGSNFTMHMQTTVEAPFDAIQLGFFNGNTGGASVIKAAISSMATAGNSEDTTSNNGGGTWVNVTASGSATLTVPQAPGVPDGQSNPGVLWSDVMQLASLTRSDVTGGFPILCVRTEYATGANFLETVNYMPSNLSGGTANYGLKTEDYAAAPWGRFCRIKAQAVLGVTTIANFTQGPSGPGHAPAVIIRYFLRNGLGRTVVVFGDSIDQGSAQVSLPPFNFVMEAQRLVSTQKAPVEICNLAVSGSSPSKWLARAKTFCQYFPGATASIPMNSPNGLTTPINEGTWRGNKVNAVQAMQYATDNKMRVICRTMTPAAYSAKAFGSSDQTFRHAENVARVATSSFVAPVYDVGGVAEGAIDANSQYTFPLADTDGLHPSGAFAIPAGALLAKIL